MQVKLLKEAMHPIRRTIGKESLVVKGISPAEGSLNTQGTRAAISRRKMVNVLPARRVRAATAEETTGVRAKGAKVLPAVNGARDVKGAKVLPAVNVARDAKVAKEEKEAVARAAEQTERTAPAANAH